jgi:hypothetical protein
MMIRFQTNLLKYFNSKFNVLKTFLIILFISIITNASAQLPNDAQGWTVYTPSSDSRIIYVSRTTGNDTTAQFYLPNAIEIGSDPFNPVGAVMPYRTIAAARANMREFFPDWLLLKRGDVWYESLSLNLQSNSGRNAAEVALFSSYSTGNRPILKTGINPGFGLSYTTSQLGNTTDNIAISHIDFYAHTRDPQSPDFDTTSGGVAGGSAGFRIVKSGRNILIEGCKFAYYVNNSVEVSPGASNKLVNFKFRRNVIDHNYRNVANTSHCQGFYAGPNVDSMLIEENIFWHNGWSEDPIISSIAFGAPATIFNRNAYLARGQKDLVVRGNIFSESSSEGVQQRSGGLCEDNLCLKNSVGILFGQYQAIWPSEAASGTLRNNVCLDSHDIDGSPRGGGIQFQQVDSVHVYNNIIAHQKSGTGNISGIDLSYNYSNMLIENNIVYDWSRPNFPNINDTRANALTINAISTNVNALIRNNEFQQPSLGFVASSAMAALPGILLNNNTYFSSSPNPPTLWSNGWFEIGSSVSANQWISQMFDTTAIFQQINYVDPARNIESYMTLQSSNPSLQSFMEEAIQQRKGYWRDEYTAYNVNCYIRDGFQTPISYLASPDTVTINLGESAILSVSNLNTNNYSLSWDGNVFTTDTTFSVNPSLTTTYSVSIIDSTQLWRMCSPTIHNFIVVVDLITRNTQIHENKSQIHIYPNPANDIISVDKIDLGKKATISIYTQQGQLLKHQALSQSITTIDISDITPGIYFVEITSDFETAVRKIVKE